MSLRWRIALGLAVIAAIVVTAGAAAAYVSTSDRLRAGIDQSLRSTADGVRHGPGNEPSHGGSGSGAASDATAASASTAAAGPASTDGSDHGQSDFSRPSGCPPAGVFQPAASAQRISSDAGVTSCIEGGPSLPVDDHDRTLAREGGETTFRTVSINGQEYRLATVAVDGGGAYQIARSLAEVHDVLDSLRARLVVIGITGVLAAALLGWFVARRTVRPIEELTATTERIARTQDLSAHVAVGGAAEIGSLGRSFTTMVDALAESRRAQQQLVRDASHELRTPLTSLRTNAELLARHSELRADQYDAIVESVQLEVGELTDLMSELVELATDSSGRDEVAEPVELGDVARAVATRARRRSGRDVTVTADDRNHTVLGQPMHLERAVSNLVDNALKYSPSPQPVEIVVDGTSVEVRDHGRGIVGADRPHVFDRFFRSVDARTAPGSGLGLAIVEQTVTRHHGTVWATNRPEGGAAVGFGLPVADDAPEQPTEGDAPHP